MSEIRIFMDAFRDSFNRFGDSTEEEQQLPSEEVLDEICRTLLHVSCMREEGRYSSFRVCFLSPDSEFLSTYLYAHALRFEEPVPFRPRDLHKLAPALNPDMSYLMVDISRTPYKAVGIIAAYTTWIKIMTLEIQKGIRMPRIPNILVKSPGELEACFGETSLVSYRYGECVFFRTDTFTSTLISKELERGSSLLKTDRLKFLYHVLWNMQKYKQGGHIFIVPSAESCSKFMASKYKLKGSIPSDFISHSLNEKDVLTYANLVAKLTTVDGGVVLTKNLELLGFGVETYVDRIGKENIEMCFMRHDNRRDQIRRFNDNGMRHRACYQFCNEVEGSVAIILSHDGGIEACTKHNGKVIVYDNVGLPITSGVHERLL